MEDLAVQQQLEVEWKRLSSAPKPGRTAAREWVKALTDLKGRARRKNPAVHKLKQLKECVRAARSKLVAAKDEVGKMREFVEQKRWLQLRGIAPGLKRCVERIKMWDSDAIIDP